MDSTIRFHPRFYTILRAVTASVALAALVRIPVHAQTPGTNQDGNGAAVVTVQGVTGMPGQTVTVEIDADAGAQNVSGAQLTVQFGAVGTPDLSNLTYGSLIEGPGATVAGNAAVPGQIAITANGTQPRNGPGEVATFPIKIAANIAPGIYPLTLTSAELLNGVQGINAQSISGTLTVSDPGTQSPAAPTLTVKGATGAPGQTVMVEIDADAAAQNVAGALLTVQFGDLGTADLSNLVRGPLIGGQGATVAGNDAVPGQVAIGANGTQAASGPGEIVAFPLTIAANVAPGVYPLTLSYAQLFDPNGVDQTVQAVSGALTIVASAPVPGDLNGDGKVDVRDVTLSLRIALGLIVPTEFQKTVGDLNHDGLIDVRDATLILQAAVGLKTLPLP